MNALASFRKCTLTDEELLQAVDNGCDEMYRTGKIPTRHIPSRPNEDFDLLLGELLIRFDERLKKENLSPVIGTGIPEGGNDY